MSALHELADGRRLIYVASRVFDYAEKLKAEYLERAVSRGISRAMRDVGIEPLPSSKFTFVPFRDTIQHSGLVDEAAASEPQELTARIYREDLARLERLFALVAFFDGVAKDEGISVEIGYAFAIGTPVLLVVTDFVGAAYKRVNGSEHVLDPVLHVMVSTVVQSCGLPGGTASFRGKLLQGLKAALRKVEDEVYGLGLERASDSPDVAEPESVAPVADCEVYLDFGGGLFEWQRMLQERVAAELGLRGIRCAQSARYVEALRHETIWELGWRDLSRAKAAKLVVTCSDSIEMNSGTAALQGFARARGKKVVLYDSKSTEMVAHPGYRSSRNLMVDYSADRSVHTLAALPDVIEELLYE